MLWLGRNPFALFFPLGAAAGVLGVGPWIIWTVGWKVDMVALLHTTLQSQAFLAAFALGFLLTAFPRFSGSAPARADEIWTAFGGLLGLVVLTWLGLWELAQISFLAAIAVLPLFALRRWKSRTKALPPSFMLLGFGLLSAVAGSVLLAASRMGFAHFDAFMTGRRLLGLGFMLCMVLGVTAKLAPFLTGHVSDPRTETLPSPAWPHAAVGLLIFASFFALPSWLRWADGLRAVLATFHLWVYAGIGRMPKNRKATSILFWHACFLVPMGLWLAWLFPDQRVAGLHVTFVGGFSLMIFSFGAMVVLNHTGQETFLGGKMLTLRIVGWLVFLAAAFRFAADFVPSRVMGLLHIAAGLWTLASAVWFAYALRFVLRASHEDH